MQMSPNIMYLRPGNLEKDFIVKRKETKISDTGTPYSDYNSTGKIVRGILADADKNQSDRKKHLWDQDQHTLTHTIVSFDIPQAKKGDIFVMEDRYFLTLLVDDTGAVGVATIYYMEERNDLR